MLLAAKMQTSSGNIMFLYLFAEVPGRGSVKQEYQALFLVAISIYVTVCRICLNECVILNKSARYWKYRQMGTDTVIGYWQQ